MSGEDMTDERDVKWARELAQTCWLGPITPCWGDPTQAILRAIKAVRQEEKQKWSDYGAELIHRQRREQEQDDEELSFWSSFL
jgi:hypothetical protein